MKKFTELKVDNDNLEFSFLLSNDKTADDLGPQVIKNGFKRQDERHITLIGGSTSVLLRNTLNKVDLKESKNILDQIKNFIEGLEWKYEIGDIYLINKSGYIDNTDVLECRQSYIMLVSMPDMGVLYEKINALLSINLPVQIPHITLFTKGERENPVWYGIPVPSKEEFGTLEPKKVNLPLTN